MTTFQSSTRNSSHPYFNTQVFEEQTKEQTLDATASLKKATRQYALFHICFFLLACAELLAFALFFSFLTQSTILAFSLAGIFLTGFTYFVFLFYLQAKKPEQLLGVRQTFLEQCRKSLPFTSGTSEYHLALGQALHDFFNHLHRQEYTYYFLPSIFKTLSPLIQKFSVWCHWKDLHQMQEMILLMMIKEHIELIKIAPTDLETHARLAHSYRILAKHYQDPRIAHPDIDHIWVSPEYQSVDMINKFEKASWRAVEEFKIMDDYAPNDPWVHAQLAEIFHDLHMAAEEIQEYEIILKSAPEDTDVLLRLGILYFKQGRNAQALSLYEQLKNTNDPKAKELLSYYDTPI